MSPRLLGLALLGPLLSNHCEEKHLFYDCYSVVSVLVEIWTDSVTFSSMEEFYSLKERQITPPMWSLNRGASDNIATMSDYHKVSRYGRHNYILGVSCVPDKNSLHPIDGFRGSSYPDPPYFSSLQDKLLGLETRSKPLADNQILQSTGGSCANPCCIG